MTDYNGLNSSLGTLPLLSTAKSRSISPENFDGKKGGGGMAETGTGAEAARELGRGWKVSPSIRIAAGETAVIADIEGPGAIKHIWLTPNIPGRGFVIRFYWEDAASPAIECPLGDFFANALIPVYTQVSSLAVCVNPKNGLNCYWEMPFRRRCRITVENISAGDAFLYYQVDYILTEIPEACGYLHAQFRRSNPLPYMGVHTLLDGVRGKGQYVGTYMLWGVHNNGWWGEGEIKFYLDGDGEYPTICGTGTEDYFCGAYNFDCGGYVNFSTPYSGMCTPPTDNLYTSQRRFSLYRWHVTDPIYFDSELRVTIQALGWRSGGRYLPLQDDLSSVSFWYMDQPEGINPPLPDRNELEIL